MTKKCTICAVTIYTSLQLITFQFIVLNMKPLVINTLELSLQQIRVNKTHPGKGWNKKVISHLTYKVFIRKNYWRLMKEFI